VTGWIVRETVTRNRPTFVQDGHGNTVPDWAATDDLPIAGCLFAPGASTEVEGGRDTIHIVGTVYAPPGADVTATDAVTVRGTRYQVTGQPQQWPAGTVITLENWAG
jgi:hypothetical protein